MPTFQDTLRVLPDAIVHSYTYWPETCAAKVEVLNNPQTHPMSTWS